MIGDADVVVGGDAQNITVIEEREAAFEKKNKLSKRGNEILERTFM